MKVSILTVTQPSREAFWPWLVKMVSRLELPPGPTGGNGDHEWLISTPSAPCPSEDVLYELLCDSGGLGGPFTWRLFSSDKKTLGERRQELLDRATGDVIAWVDDDDWHHPRRIMWDLECLQRMNFDHPLATGAAKGIVRQGVLCVELTTGRGLVTPLIGVPISFVGDRTFARSARFPAIDQGEDARWLAALEEDPYGLWSLMPEGRRKLVSLVHGQSSSAAQQRSWRFTMSPEDVANYLGPQWQKDQPDLEALRARLKLP